MIVNIPVNNVAPNNTTTASATLNQGQTEYTNFLKRKYNDRELNHNAPCSLTSNSEEINSNIASNNWKKRHIDQPLIEDEEDVQENYNEPLTTSFSSASSESYKQNHLNDTQESSAGGSFNIIANSSAFFNDLFAYDANLLVPVTGNSLSDSMLTDSVIFSTPSTVSANTKTDFNDDDNGENWQASDLLELDHRYNSTLQMEIAQLNPTISLKHAEDQSNLLLTNQVSPPAANDENHQFALPQKPITSKRLNATPLSAIMSSLSSSCSSTSSSPAVSNYNVADHMEQDCDFEDKNLSWLLNFKFDEFPHLNPDLTGLNNNQKSTKANTYFGNNSMQSIPNHYNSSLPSCSSNQSTVLQQAKSIVTTACAIGTANGTTLAETSKTAKTVNNTGKKFEELVMEVTSELEANEMVVAENVVIEETSHRTPKKPPFTYTELIEYALEDKGELTVSGIYQWISDRFPYYKSNDDRWKNSVRHNLSINPHFRKGHKAPQGAGHLWTISSGDSAENVLAWEHKKQRLDLFFKMESMNRERLQQHQQKQQQERLRNQSICQQDACTAAYDEAAIAASNIQQEMLQQQHHNNNNDTSIQNQNSLSQTLTNGHNLHATPSSSTSSTTSSSYNDLLTDEELRKTAGQILNGIHREVEVQAVNQALISTYQDVLLDNDYLNPIHKDVVVNESGLRHPSHTTISTHGHSNNHTASPSSTGLYCVTDIDPLELGIHMTTHPHQHHQHQHQQSTSSQNQSHHSQPPTTVHHVDEESDVILFNDEFNLNYFTYHPNNDIVS